MTASSPATAELPLPRKIGRYTLFDHIGRGGMADIFLARVESELGASRLVVVKQMLAHLAASREFSELLITEAKLSARLDHANIVQVHDLGRVDGYLFISMQYVEGFDLTELLRLCSRTKTPLPVQYALLVVIEALRGLDYAHRRTSDDGAPLGIVHRDVSPSNVLISLDGEVKLCDFGIAHANDVLGTYSDEAIKGKAAYMSPEQARGDPLDARADVFAIGIVLWELLCGRRLYRNNNEPGGSLLAKARAAEIPEIPSRSLPLEDQLYAISKRALARNREERYPSAHALLLDLEQYVAASMLMASPIRFGEWLVEHFGAELIERRRAHERAAQALEAEHRDASARGRTAGRRDTYPESDPRFSTSPEKSAVALHDPAADPLAELSPGPFEAAGGDRAGALTSGEQAISSVLAPRVRSFPGPAADPPARTGLSGSDFPRPVVRAPGMILRIVSVVIALLVVFLVVTHC